MKSVVFSLAILAAAVAHAAPPVSAVPAGVKAHMAETAKDPDSLRYGRFSQPVSGEGRFRYVCGFVNGKNSYGGYTGNKLYLFTIIEGTVVDASDVSEMRAIGGDLDKCLSFGVTGKM